eukprot:scaffold86968_cov39-Attheya_sp.AAC.1
MTSSAAAAREESRFLTVPHLKAVGIGETDGGRLFYKRDSVRQLLQFLDDATGRYGFIDGLPGRNGKVVDPMVQHSLSGNGKEGYCMSHGCTSIAGALSRNMRSSTTDNPDW